MPKPLTAERRAKISRLADHPLTSPEHRWAIQDLLAELDRSKSDTGRSWNEFMDEMERRMRSRVTREIDQDKGINASPYRPDSAVSAVGLCTPVQQQMIDRYIEGRDDWLARAKPAPDARAERLHYEMNCAVGEVTVALERHGFDPCSAMKIAEEAMRRAWAVWGQQEDAIASAAAEIAELRAEVAEWRTRDILRESSDAELKRLRERVGNLEDEWRHTTELVRQKQDRIDILEHNL